MDKYYRTYAQINLKNIQNNISYIRNSIGGKVKIFPAIKADAYGHGIEEVAKALDSFVDGFSVATTDEAVNLRETGITKPILILGTVSKYQFEDAVKSDVIVPVYTVDMARELSLVSENFGKKTPVHLVVDTGMNRIGMTYTDEGIEIAKKIAEFTSLDVCGIFSHLAKADFKDKTFANLQYERFVNFCDKLEKTGITGLCRHIANSAAILDLPHFSLDMVRPGIITYGLAPSDETSYPCEIKPALELKSHIMYIKTVKKGEGISYGLTHITDSDRKIATVCAGYGDGYPRLLSNKGRVLVRGQYANIVGRICMDQFMIDVTDIDGVETDDVVTLIGKDGNLFISADEVAKNAGTINYEITCTITKRVNKIYITE